MSPTKQRLNVSDWESAIEREPRSFAAEPTALEVLRQRFRDISTRTREHRQSGWINRPGFAALRKISDSALELTQLAFHELSQFDNPAAPTIPLHALSQLLVENQARLVEIDERLGRLQSQVSIAEQLREPLEQLVQSGSGTWGLWNAQVGELSVSEFVQTPGGIDAWTGSDLDNFLEMEAWPQAWFYVPAIHRALWTVKLQRTLPELQPYPVDVIALPALLADCGLLIQCPEPGRFSTTAPSPAMPDYQRHPEVSAALISMIGHASPLSSLLVSQHHERLDGTGYPRRLKFSDLNAVSRCFTVVTRWSELLLQSAGSGTASDSRVEAARTLTRDAWQGTLDQQIVQRLLATIEAGIPVETHRMASTAPMSPFSEPSPAPQTTSGEASPPLRIIDGPEPIAPPAMLNHRVAAFKENGPSARPTPPPRPAVSGYR